MRTAQDLRPLQRDALQFMYTTRRGHLWLDVGMGKTAVALTWLADMFARGKALRTLVVAPKAIAVDTWTDEMAQWEHLCHLRQHTRVLTGMPSAKRAEAMLYNRMTRIDIINYDCLPWLDQLVRKHKLTLSDFYDVAICDEVTRLKQPSGRWFRIAVQHFYHMHYFWGLTGSPASEGYEQLWAPVFLIDYGTRLYPDITSYRNQYFYPTPRGYDLRDRAEGEVQGKLADVVYTQSADLLEDGLMPELVEHFVPVTVDEHTLELYREMEQELAITLTDGESIAPNAGVMLGKCQQILGGAIYLNDAEGLSTKDWETIDTSKLDALEDLVGTLNGQPLLVLYGFEHEKVRLLERFEHMQFMNSSNVREMSAKWNDGKVPLLLAHPQSCGHGLNLQKGPGHHLCFYTTPWSRESYEQTVGRLRRPGQRARSVVVHLLTVGDSVDTIIAMRQRAKGARQVSLKRSMMALQARRAA